jgi:hypothetical protein
LSGFSPFLIRAFAHWISVSSCFAIPFPLFP